ncbi:uncharacterized protein BCR38DRAFT_522029 [Pseudomassariella vexata]|uniref:Uncharacterized protein n=1 Tax=Pseudomassariella vexata TaxID=1141098 RepID=A0A1Y2E612_9PEZI|nr:uncharacterized protein BCR38DRAFT_522029 [Pseudomassariella vexata]ORY66998.1 hypothetical protein BCR38DRAFT_522029 [Pseudomassariella vexata]
MAQRYAISTVEEAVAYLEHPILGKRIRETAQAVLDNPAKSAMKMLGDPDYCKFQSSMTLFRYSDLDEDNVFGKVLDRFYEGKLDERMYELIEEYGEEREEVE